MGRNIRDVVRDLCLAFPQAQERTGHGMPDYKVGGRTFAMLAVNHHGDGRIALWVHSPPGVQQLHTQGEPRFYFVPPYIGHRGWIDMDIEHHIDWDEVRDLALGSYRHFALQRMLKALAKLPDEETRV